MQNHIREKPLPHSQKKKQKKKKKEDTIGSFMNMLSNLSLGIGNFTFPHLNIESE